MQITKDTVVQFHYTLSDETGVLENSRSQDPVLYLQGHGNLIEGLEKSMEPPTPMLLIVSAFILRFTWAANSISGEPTLKT